jgi:23S rRNA (uracil1939-C5)-methyltransferase
MVVFVPLVLPGERVQVEIVHKRKSFWRGRPVQWLVRRPDRAEPPCPYFGVCGGCQLQHLTYEAQLAGKTAFVREQFRNIGKFEGVPVAECIPCPVPLGYRNHVQFSLDEHGVPGYHPPRRHGVLPIEHCLIAEPDINQALADLRAGRDNALVQRHALHADVRVNMEPIHVCGRDYHVSRDSFFQVNTRMAAKLVEHAIDQLALQRHESALDLYCGVGLFTVHMIERCDYVVGIEFGESSTRDARRNLRKHMDEQRVRILTADVTKALQRGDIVNERWDAVLMDPPRAGVQYEALKRVIALAPKRIVYVSCDPATLARDARILCDSGYALHAAQPFDMFPQTNHVETCAKFVRA